MREYIGNCIDSFDENGECTNPRLPWASVNDFACDVQESDNITLGNLRIEYDEERDVHSFYLISIDA